MDLLDGGRHQDILCGGSGSDVLIGGDGEDTLTGGAGDDFLIGGNASATLDQWGHWSVEGVVGDGKRDEFRITGFAGAGYDTILGFEAGTDLLRFKDNGVLAASQIGNDVLIDTSRGGGRQGRGRIDR